VETFLKAIRVLRSDPRRPHPAALQPSLAGSGWLLSDFAERVKFWAPNFVPKRIEHCGDAMSRTPREARFQHARKIVNVSTLSAQSERVAAIAAG
jgi:hypothetical protein